jgi:hypothetical protein
MATESIHGRDVRRLLDAGAGADAELTQLAAVLDAEVSGLGG